MIFPRCGIVRPTGQNRALESWTEMWSDAVARSRGTHDCLKHADSLKEATALLKKGGCEKGAFGKEGEQQSGKLGKAEGQTWAKTGAQGPSASGPIVLAFLSYCNIVII